MPKDATVRAMMDEAESREPALAGDAAKSWIVTEAPFQLKLISAQRVGRKIICAIEIKNITGDDADFIVVYGKRYKTQVFAESGDEANISAVNFANRLRRMKGLSQYESVKKKILAGQSVALELHFDKLPSTAKRIALLQILGNRDVHYEFRDIPIIDGV